MTCVTAFTAANKVGCWNDWEDVCTWQMTNDTPHPQQLPKDQAGKWSAATELGWRCCCSTANGLIACERTRQLHCLSKQYTWLSIITLANVDRFLKSVRSLTDSQGNSLCNHCRAFHLTSSEKTWNLVGRLTVANASWGWQTVTDRGVVSSRKPLKFWWAPTVSPERLKLEWSNFAWR